MPRARAPSRPAIVPPDAGHQRRRRQARRPQGSNRPRREGASVPGSDSPVVGGTGGEPFAEINTSIHDPAVDVAFHLMVQFDVALLSLNEWNSALF